MAKRVRPNPVKPTGKRIAVEYWNITRLNPFKGNPRKNEHAIDQMRGSIREFGFTVPILAKSDTGEICDGHLRLKAALAEGMTEVPVIPCDDWTDAQIKAFRITINRSATWGKWDEDLLRTELLDLKAFKFDLGLTGFDALEIDSLLSGKGVDGKKPKAGRQRNGSEPAAANTPVISYNIIFANEDDQRKWFDFLKRLRTLYPEIPTVAERIVLYCESNQPK